MSRIFQPRVRNDSRSIWTMARSASSRVALSWNSMITPFLVRSSGRAQPTAAATTSPGTSLVMAGKRVGTMAPGRRRGRSSTSASGGRIEETLTRLMLPMPAARRALSKALSEVSPSALPDVVAALVTGVQPIRSRLLRRSGEGRLLEKKPLDHVSGSERERKKKSGLGEPFPRLRAARGRRGKRRPACPRRVLGSVKIRRRGHFFLAMPKTWPYIQKTCSQNFRGRATNGEEGESASTGATPAARVVRLRRGSAQQPRDREDVHGRGGQARAGHHRGCGFPRVQSVRHQRRRRYCRVAPRHSHLAGIPLRRRRRVLLRRCPPASDGRRLSRRAAGGGPGLRGRAPARHLPPDRAHAAQAGGGQGVWRQGVERQGVHPQDDGRPKMTVTG